MVPEGESTTAAGTSMDACWICGAHESSIAKRRSIERALSPEDLRITDHRYGETLTLRRCAACGFLFAEGAEVSELVSLYEQLHDPDYQATQDTRVLQMRWILGRVTAAAPDARTLLDVGAGAGLLVAEARRIGLQAVGIEPSRSLVLAAPRVNGVNLLQGVFPHPDLQGTTFDVITLVDVIEHVTNPVALLRACRDALTDDGLLVVVTPDVSSLAARWLGKRWWHFRLAHVGYFARHTLTVAAGAAGLTVQRLFRAKWFFRVAYLAARMGEYLPVRWLNRLAERSAPLRWLYDRVVPLNLHDSWVCLMRPRHTR